MDVTWAGAFLAGLLSFFSPCVLPIVPPYLCFLAGLSLDQLTGDAPAAAARRRVVLSSVAFALGFMTVFVALGATASWVGQALARYFDVLRWVAGALIILLGLHFLGFLRIPLLYREARAEVTRKPAGLLGAYIVGLAFAFGWTPCVGPVLAAILFTAGAMGSPAAGAALLFVYALGMALPFVGAAFFTGPFMRLMRRFRPWLGRVEKVMGGALILTGLVFVTGHVNTIAQWMLDVAPDIGTIQ